MSERKSGDKVGQWELVEILGKGGNGEVWKVRSLDNTPAALKISTKPKVSAFERFKAEVYIHLHNSDVPGVLPIIEHFLPSAFDPENPPWFVMPLVRNFSRMVRYDFREIVLAIISVAETMEILHSRNVVHRDLKPENLLYHQGRPYVGDFGIADYPEKNSITRNNDQLGAYWTIAPEMESSAGTADGRKADVYSLAKTLWMLLAGEKRSFGGQYLSGSQSMALSGYFPKIPLIHMIEGLLASATAPEPDARPDMASFRRIMKDWAEKAENFKEVSLGDWGALQRYLFPVNVPQRAIWSQTEDIVAVLNLIGKYAELNHVFSPDGGGLDLASAKFSVERDCIELRFETHLIEIVKPKRLIFESFPGFSEWTYFRLETEELAPSDTYEGGSVGTYEEVLEIEPGEYHPRTVYDQGFIGYDEDGHQIPLPNGARVITRQFRGSYVVFAKASHYNETDSYQGKHNRYDADRFRDEINKIVKKYGQQIRDAEIRRKQMN